jgi:hypothetical protein
MEVELDRVTLVAAVAVAGLAGLVVATPIKVVAARS